jgi:hypothetical protein
MASRSVGNASFVTLDEAARQISASAGGGRRGGNGEMSAAADYLGPGAIEINRYQAEIVDMVRRRFPFGQRVNQTPATGQPSRFFEQLAIPSAQFTPPRALTTTPSQPQRVERVLSLKAITAQINYGLFDVEVNQQQGQFAYLEAKDLTDTVDGVLKLHDQSLWNGNDTDLLVPTSTAYFGVIGQLTTAAAQSGGNPTLVIPASGSLVDGVKLQIARMASRQDYEVRPSGIYTSPLMLDLFDKEAKAQQLYFNQVEILPGVVVEGIPTQMGVLPLIGDASVPVTGTGPTYTYSGFIISEDMIEYHYLTDPLPRVFQLGLAGNLSAQYVVVKFGGIVAKGALYAHSVFQTTR